MSACHPCSVSRQIGADNCYHFLLPTFAHRSIPNLLTVHRIWRKRVGVEPTIRPAKDRIAGFEGRERHRTLFASANSIVSDLQTLKERQARWEVSVAACCVRIKAATRSYSAQAVQTS